MGRGYSCAHGSLAWRAVSVLDLSYSIVAKIGRVAISYLYVNHSHSNDVLCFSDRLIDAMAVVHVPGDHMIIPKSLRVYPRTRTVTVVQVESGLLWFVAAIRGVVRPNTA